MPSASSDIQDLRLTKISFSGPRSAMVKVLEDYLIFFGAKVKHFLNKMTIFVAIMIILGNIFVRI